MYAEMPGIQRYEEKMTCAHDFRNSHDIQVESNPTLAISANGVNFHQFNNRFGFHIRYSIIFFQVLSFCEFSGKDNEFQL